ncbi:MAG: response regulator, partial [Planctomycetota bacterium]
NLLINASESMEGRPGTVHVQTETVFLDQKALSRFDVDETPAEGRFVCLSVTDRGTGMDAATLQRIFDPFYSTKFTGRGLGLAAVQGIVLRHGGAIRVESEFGRGSRFEVVLPAAGASSLETSESSESPGTRERLTPEVPSPSRGRRVLVVDDEPAVLRVALASLERHGYEVLDATDGDEAIQLCERELNSLDAVVLDLTLPRLNGLQVLDRIFALRQDVPVVVCSGYNETSLQESPHREKLAAFLHKPYLPTDLVSAVRRALSTNLEPRGLRELA